MSCQASENIGPLHSSICRSMLGVTIYFTGSYEQSLYVVKTPSSCIINGLAAALQHVTQTRIFVDGRRCNIRRAG